MRTYFARRALGIVAALAALYLSLQVLVGSLSWSEDPAETSPLPPDQYRLVDPQSYRYVLNQPCRLRDKNPFLVFMVPVTSRNSVAREAVRRTWGGPRLEILTLFFAGVPQGDQASQIREELQEESRRHGDIVLMDFVDSYQNLTVKTVMMMSWLATFCPGTAYAMKVDADNFVNVFHLLRRLRASPRQGFITGSVIRDGIPRRDPSSKWYLSEQLYPEDTFPPYVSGAGYVFSADLAARICWASRFVPVIPLEDVYVGLCLRLLAVRPAYSQSLPFFRNLFEVQKLEYDRCTFARLVLVNGFSPPKLLQAWQDFSQGHQSC